ncbi:hypothetical protein [Bradyrhizobium canariense]|uniref:Uncharacterized protein n=1 Tax=Bradyrhizobium canariense TaxID=255045 RepID=A0A1H1WC18_9BRAD|nr:hypothetical protein [Bradyrhizobium canariense]SDS93699.1 hypothetical protein SAMN05444158_3747 [Bradyrhizobium canariense]
MTTDIPETALAQQESVPSALETSATGEIADIYSDIRATLGTSVVNLIWRNLATMPGALQWTWSTVRPLYLGPAAMHAEAVRHTLSLPDAPALSIDTLTAAGIDRTARTEIRTILNSYHHTNALALVVLSALLEHYHPSVTDIVHPSEAAPVAAQTELPKLPSMASLPAEVRRLIEELNKFGEDTDPFLIASMYRHLAYWPPYLAVVRTMLAPLQGDGQLTMLTRSARALGRAHGRILARHLTPAPPPESLEQALASCRLFVEHPIARMTGICAIVRRATPE